MNKKIATILSCFVMLAVSAILLLTFLTDKKGNEKEFYCTAQDVNLCLGESAYNYYQVSHPLSLIEISVEKEDIIEIDNDKITAIGIGSTKVTLSATYGEKQSQATFTVKVTEQNFSVEFSAIADCYFEGNTLFAESNTCQFVFDVYNSQGIKMPTANYEISVEGDGTANKNFYGVTLAITGNCKITFIFAELEFEISIDAHLCEG